MVRQAVVALLTVAGLLSTVATSIASEPLAKGIQDNSFFIEEAYNQEPGVVQHIMNIVYAVDRRAGPDEREWAFIFTQEWPAFSQTHQLSYTIPYLFIDDGDSRDGLGDIILNYRFQA